MPDLWPFVPLLGMQETLEFFSNVMRTYTKEQRLQIRNRPRQTFQYVHHFQDQVFSKAKAFADQHTNEDVYVPVWMEAVRVNGVGALDTTINLDTTYGDWRVGSSLAIWTGYENYAVCEIASIGPTSIGLTSAPAANYHNPYIIPLRNCRMRQGWQISRKSMYSRMTVIVSVNDNAHLIADDATELSGFSSYDGFLILPAPPFEAADTQEAIMLPSTYFDNGMGPVIGEPSRVINDFGQMLSFLDRLGPDLWTRRMFLHWIRGKQMPFLWSTYNNDLKVNRNIGSGDGDIRVDRIIDDTTWYVGQYIALRTKAGGTYISKITAASDSPGPLGDLLTLLTPIGVNIAYTDVSMVSFMSLVRSNTDSFTFSQTTPNMVSMTMPVMAVPE